MLFRPVLSAVQNNAQQPLSIAVRGLNSWLMGSHPAGSSEQPWRGKVPVAASGPKTFKWPLYNKRLHPPTQEGEEPR